MLFAGAVVSTAVNVGDVSTAVDIVVVNFNHVVADAIVVVVVLILVFEISSVVGPTQGYVCTLG